MEKNQIANPLGTETASVDVLFVTNQLKMPAQIGKLLLDNKFTWAKIGVDKFAYGLDDSGLAGIIGTIIVDTTQIKESQIDKFLRTVKRLEQADVATILLNNHINFPFDKFELATILQSASLEEMWGRIATNVAYRKRLASSYDVKDRPDGLADDTANQLKMAGRVQRNFLPSQLPNSNIVRWSTVFQPADWVSGDIYDITRLDERHIGFYIADAVGHSMPAALLTMFLKQAINMRQTTKAGYRIFPPLEVIRNLNAALLQEQLTDCLFATCCYCLLNHQSLELTYCRAGHPYPVLIRKGQPPEQLQNRGGLLGVFEDAQFEQETIQLDHGDKLLIYSDGVESLIGQCDNENDFKFTEQFYSIAALQAKQLTSRLEELIKNQQIAPAQIDDITAIVLEIQ